MSFVPGTLFLIDTSAMTRIADKEVRDIVAGVIDAGMAATTITVELEAGYSGRSADEILQIFQTRQEFFTYLPVTQNATGLARRTQVKMAQQGLHRAAGVMDILTAAIAEVNGATVLHYDADFDHIASVSALKSQWVVPRGSVS